MASVCERNALGRLMCGVVLYVTSDLIHYEPTHRHGIALPRGTAGPIRVGVPVGARLCFAPINQSILVGGWL